MFRFDRQPLTPGPSQKRGDARLAIGAVTEASNRYTKTVETFPTLAPECPMRIIAMDKTHRDWVNRPKSKRQKLNTDTLQ